MQLLATQEGGTFFFDQDTDFVEGFSSSLRSELVFGVPATGTDGTFGSAQAIYEDMGKGALTLDQLLLLLWFTLPRGWGGDLEATLFASLVHGA